MGCRDSRSPSACLVARRAPTKTQSNQTLFFEGRHVREHRLPCCGIGIGWFLFITSLSRCNAMAKWVAVDRITGYRRLRRALGVVLFLMLSMFATMAAFYVAGRLWQDAENRVYLIDELDERTGQGKSSVSVDGTLKIISCRENLKKLAALHVDLEKARQEGFVTKHLTENGRTSKKQFLAVVGIITMFGRQNNRDAIRKAWMPTGCDGCNNGRLWTDKDRLMTRHELVGV